MGMVKNLTPRQISFITSIVLTLLLSIMGVLYIFFGDALPDGLIILLFVILIFAGSYLLISFMLERYIYRKVKLIYKIIHKSKTSVQNKTDITKDEHILQRVSDEVKEWAESQEREIQSLKKLEKYRRGFLGNVSHELKTPIFTIQGYIHTLIDGGLYDEEINMKYMKKAAANAERLQNIVEDLEVISRLETGSIALDITNFDIRDLAKDVISDAQFQAAEKNITIELKDGSDKSFVVSADRDNITQVLNNLITNSIKYGKDNGKTKIGFYDMDKFLLVEISDNGIGIEEKHLKHLFDRFYRVDKSRSRTMGGSGLGLAIVKHILEAHNQTINVRSTLGQGSTFGFTVAKAGN
jgi:two-component system phosphate regulon sensor histidine kinase PhoR